MSTLKFYFLLLSRYPQIMLFAMIYYPVQSELLQQAVFLVVDLR